MLENINLVVSDFFNYIPNVTGVKLVLTSPPYMDARLYNNELIFKDEDVWFEWCVNAIVELEKTLADDGVIWWNTGSGYADGYKRVAVYKLVAKLNSLGIYLIDEIPWIKSSSLPKRFSNRPYSAWEHNYLFSRNPKNVKFYVDHVRRPYAPATISRLRYATAKLQSESNGEFTGVKHVVANPLGASPPNYLILSADVTKRPHPAPMNPQVANWAIRAYTDEGDLVYDPMVGCGTTLIESVKLSRRFIGTDIYEDYINISKLSLERLSRGEDPYNGLKSEYEKGI